MAPAIGQFKVVVGAGALALGTGLAGTVFAATASADELVTYEIVSDSIGIVDAEYVGRSGRERLVGATLPWRMDVILEDAQGPTGRGAQLRADWRSIRGPARWVTVRIYQGSTLLCQATLDVGNIACYGNTPHVA